MTTENKDLSKTGTVPKRTQTTRIDPEIVAQMPNLKDIKPKSCIEKLKDELNTSINS